MLYNGSSESYPCNYIGKFEVGGEILTIGFGTASDDDDMFENNYFVVTYNGKTVYANTGYPSSDRLSNGIEFTIDGTTYVAKLNNGEMTVTAK